MSAGVRSGEEVVSGSQGAVIILVGALLAGAAARVWLFLSTVPERTSVDWLFDTLGWNLAQGLGFTLDGLTPAAHVGPLYPLLLALFYEMVGHRPEWVVALHLGVDVGTWWCLYRAGRLLFGPTIGALGAAGFFLYPAYWTYDIRLRGESVLTLLVTAWLWASLSCVQMPSRKKYLLSGLLSGLTVLCKPVALPTAIVLGLFAAGMRRPWRAAALCLGVYLGAAALVVVPWTLRNAYVFGSFIPVSAGVGAGLWMGSDPVSGGSWPMPLNIEAQIWETAGIAPLPYPHAMYDVQTDQALRAKGLARIRREPARYLRLTAERALHFWVGNRYYLMNGDGGVGEALRRDAGERGWLVAAYSLVKRTMLVPALLGLAGWTAWRLRDRWREMFPVYVLPAGITLGYVPFTVESGRYMLSVLPCVLLLAAASLAEGGPLARLWPRTGGEGASQEVDASASSSAETVSVRCDIMSAQVG